MKKINYHKQEQDLADRPFRFVRADSNSRSRSNHGGIVTEPATKEQLRLLSRLGIYPKWQATRYEAQEMIDHHELIIRSVNRRPW